MYILSYHLEYSVIYNTCNGTVFTLYFFDNLHNLGFYFKIILIKFFVVHNLPDWIYERVLREQKSSSCEILKKVYATQAQDVPQHKQPGDILLQRRETHSTSHLNQVRSQNISQWESYIIVFPQHYVSAWFERYLNLFCWCWGLISNLS